MNHWEVEVNGKKANVRGKELKNGLFAAFKNHFSDLKSDEEFTITVKPIAKPEKPAAEKKEKKEKTKDK